MNKIIRLVVETGTLTGAMFFWPNFDHSLHCHH